MNLAYHDRIDRVAITNCDDGIDQRVQHHAAGVRLVAVGFDQPALSEPGGQLLRLRYIAVDASEALFALDDFLCAVESALGEQCRQHAVGRGLAGVKRLAHRAAILLHACSLGRCDAHRVGQPLPSEIEQPAAGDTCGNGSERARQMPTALVMTRRGAAAAHAGFETHRIGQHEVRACHRRALRHSK